MKLIHTIAFILVIVGGLNWGLTAFGWNIVEKLLGAWPTVEMVVYVLVGVSALYLLVTHKRTCSDCCAPKGSAQAMPPEQAPM